MYKQNAQSNSGSCVSKQQRVRNILTLEERVRVIEAYDRKPMYTKVASMFNCSWEQIKNIIQNRKAIIDFFEATKANGPSFNPDQEVIKQRKINFLGECMYEYIQRAQFHTRADLNERIIRLKASEFGELIQIDNFLANKSWLNQFKITYNISLSNRQIMLTRAPPASLDLKDIMTYCSRNKLSFMQTPAEPQSKSRNLYKMTTSIAIDSDNTATMEEMKLRRQRKINFLEKALYEYIQRSQYHHKMPLNEELLRKVACELKEMLKIDNFYPNKSWFNHFKMHYNFTTSQGTIVFTRTPPFSLDLKDILSYCSRIDNKNKNTLTNQNLRTYENKAKTNIILRTQSAGVKTIELPDDEENDINLNIGENANSRIRKIIIAKPKNLLDLEDKEKNQETAVTPEVADEDEDEDIKPNINEIATDSGNVKIIVAKRKYMQDLEEEKTHQSSAVTKIEDDDDDDSNDDIKPNIEELQVAMQKDNDEEAQTPPLKIQKIESINECSAEQPHSPGHWSEHTDDDDEELPKHIRNYTDALKLLRPLEEFAMLEENYRVIGLISQLEDIFKNPPEKLE